MRPTSFFWRLGAAFLSAAAFGRSAWAQETFCFEGGEGLEQMEDEVPRAPFVLEGFVDPGGAPAEGAVVVTSAGGQAVTGQDGRYRLEVQVPLDAESVQVTAVGSTGGNLLSAASGYAWVAPLDSRRAARARRAGCQRSEDNLARTAVSTPWPCTTTAAEGRSMPVATSRRQAAWW